MKAHEPMDASDAFSVDTAVSRSTGNLNGHKPRFAQYSLGEPFKSVGVKFTRS